ncbi:MAG: shikimate kinase AroK, partial [Pseudomonadota bacterium]
MKRPINLFLVGPMGAGKSTIGRHLARTLKMDFLDTDQEIELSTGADIAWIFDVEGEEGFRQREIQAIDRLSQKQGIVLATGGGAILAPENRKCLAARGTVVYLKTSVAQQLVRTQHDKKRPLIEAARSGETEEELRRIMEEREPLYREIADMTVTTDGRTVKAVAAE